MGICEPEGQGWVQKLTSFYKRHQWMIPHNVITS